MHTYYEHAVCSFSSDEKVDPRSPHSVLPPLIDVSFDINEGIKAAGDAARAKGMLCMGFDFLELSGSALAIIALADIMPRTQTIFSDIGKLRFSAT